VWLCNQPRLSQMMTEAGNKGAYSRRGHGRSLKAARGPGSTHTHTACNYMFIVCLHFADRGGSYVFIVFPDRSSLSLFITLLFPSPYIMESIVIKTRVLTLSFYVSALHSFDKVSPAFREQSRRGPLEYLLCVLLPLFFFYFTAIARHLALRRAFIVGTTQPTG